MRLAGFVASPPSVEVLAEQQCRELLRSCDVGRVVTSIDALPAAYPVTYRLVGDDIVFRAGADNARTAVLHRSVVGFEVDRVDETEPAPWSVLVIGVAAVVDDPAERAAFDELGIRNLAHDGCASFMKVPIQQISGRRRTAVG